MKFIDKAKIYIKSGNGGNGCVSFRREKFVPEGGPNGGDGGNGGNIIFYIDPNKSTLIDFASKTHFKAENGASGSSQNCTGKTGENLILSIPAGTQIWDAEQQNMLIDAVEPGSQFIFLQGGEKGVGNTRFKSSTNRLPTTATKGALGEELWIWLILKVLADVAYVGLPNAGKSSLLNCLSSANSHVANYPFTTLSPQLGMLHAEQKLIMADLPGIIQDAHKNKGLGLQFLGHIERCYGILYVLDISADYLESFNILQYEIRQYSPELLQKKQIIALNKIDLVSEEELTEAISELNKLNLTVCPISCISKIGIENLSKNLLDIKFKKA